MFYLEHCIPYLPLNAGIVVRLRTPILHPRHGFKSLAIFGVNDGFCLSQGDCPIQELASLVNVCARRPSEDVDAEESGKCLATLVCDQHIVACRFSLRSMRSV